MPRPRATQSRATRFRLRAASVATLLIAANAAAQEPPTELADAGAAFRAKLQERLETLNRSYVAALQKVESELAAAGDYDGAIAARQERIAVGEQIVAAALREQAPRREPPPTAAMPAAEPIVFEAEAALLGGTAARAGAGARLADSGSSLSWKLPGPMPGHYDVAIAYRADAAATVWVRERFFRLKGELPAGADAPPLPIGALKLTADADAIAVTPLELPPGGITVQQLTLTPRAD